MTDSAEDFLGRFALPLVQGTAVQVGIPLGRRGSKRLLQAIAAGLDGTPVGEALAEARQRRLLTLVPGAAAPRLGDDRSGAMLLVALHDLLFLHHPAASRLSERQTELLRGFALQLGERAERQLPIVATALPDVATGVLPTGSPDARRLGQAEQRLLGRHSLLGGLFKLWRSDTSSSTLWGPREYRGVPAPAPRRALLGRTPRALPERRQVQVLPELLAQPESAAAVRSLLAASPLTALLPPAGCGLMPALAEQASWLRVPVTARLLVAHYLAMGAGTALSEVGGAVSALLHRSPAASTSPPLSTIASSDHLFTIASGDLMTLLCLLGHLHVCVALSPAALPTEAAGTLRDSYALYAAVAARWPLLSAPRDVLYDPALSARLASYLRACRTVAGPAAIRALDELCQVALATPRMAADPGPVAAALSIPVAAPRPRP